MCLGHSWIQSILLNKQKAETFNFSKVFRANSGMIRGQVHKPVGPHVSILEVYSFAGGPIFSLRFPIMWWLAPSFFAPKACEEEVVGMLSASDGLHFVFARLPICCGRQVGCGVVSRSVVVVVASNFLLSLAKIFLEILRKLSKLEVPKCKQKT